MTTKKELRDALRALVKSSKQFYAVAQDVYDPLVRDLQAAEAILDRPARIIGYVVRSNETGLPIYTDYDKLADEAGVALCRERAVAVMRRRNKRLFKSVRMNRLVVR